jgi:hypothetical protein
MERLTLVDERYSECELFSEYNKKMVNANGEAVLLGQVGS